MGGLAHGGPDGEDDGTAQSQSPATSRSHRDAYAVFCRIRLGPAGSVNFSNLREGRGPHILVSAAGIVVNMCLAFAALFLLRAMAISPQTVAGQLLYYFAHINIILAAFNLIPIPPLDGSKILMGFLPLQLQYSLSRLEPYGFFIIIGLLFFWCADSGHRCFPFGTYGNHWSLSYVRTKLELGRWNRKPVTHSLEPCFFLKFILTFR